jgi:hypothetical protein
MQNLLLALIRLDLLLESIAGFIALAVSHFASKAFRLTGQKKLSDLSTGFLVLSAAMFGHVIGTWYFFVLQAGDGGSGSNSLIVVVRIAYGAMKVMAYILFAISTRPSTGGQSPALGLFMALPILIDPNLDMIAIIVLIVVVLQSVVNYLAVRSRYALYVVVGFSFLLLSHVFAIPAEVDLRGYGLSQVFQFLGYIALLVMLVRAGREA